MEQWKQGQRKRERRDFLILPDLKNRTDIIHYDWKSHTVTWHKKTFDAPFNMGVINLRTSVLICGGFLFKRDTTCSTRDTRQITGNIQIRDLQQMIYSRSFFSMTHSKHQQMIYAIGGMREFHNLDYTGAVEVYHRKQNTWKELPSLQRSRMCSGSLSSCDMLYSFFGQNQNFRETSIEKLNLGKPNEGWSFVEFKHKQWRGVSWFNGVVLRRSAKILIFGQDFYRPLVSDFIASIGKEGFIEFKESSRQKFVFSYNRYKVIGDEIYCYDETFEEKAWSFKGNKWNQENISRLSIEED